MSDPSEKTKHVTVPVLVAIISMVAIIFTGVASIISAKITTNVQQKEKDEAIIQVKANAETDLEKAKKDEYERGYLDGISKANEDNSQKLADEYNRGYEDGRQSVSLPTKSHTEQTTNAPTSITAPDKKSVFLQDLDYFNQQSSDPNLMYFENFSGEWMNDSTNEVHSSGLIFSTYAGNIYREYLINGDYLKLKGVFALTFPSRTRNDKLTLYIYGDGKLLFTSKTHTSGVMPESIEVDVSGVNNLKCEVKVSGGSRTYCGFYDAELIP